MAVRTQVYRYALVALALVAGVAPVGAASAQHRPRPDTQHRDRADRSRPEPPRGPEDRPRASRDRDGEPDDDQYARAMRRRPEQDAALEMRRAGSIRPLREIEGRVVPRMGGAAYLGPELDSGSGVYRLKFMRAGSVIWVDVDARTGAIIGKSGN